MLTCDDVLDSRKSHVCGSCCAEAVRELEKEERKDYALQPQFNEKPGIIPGCPGVLELSKSSLQILINGRSYCLFAQQPCEGCAFAHYV